MDDQNNLMLQIYKIMKPR